MRAAAAGETYLNPRLGGQLAAARDDEEPEIGSVFAGHRIDALAGRGGMAVVYRATDLALDRSVALKLIASALGRDPVFRARFERECRLAAAIEHPHVVAVYHAGEERGRLYLTMRSWRARICAPCSRHEDEPRRAVTLVQQVAGGLDEAHRRGLVHRDVKPSNVLVGARHGQERAWAGAGQGPSRPSAVGGPVRPRGARCARRLTQRCDRQCRVIAA